MSVSFQPVQVAIGSDGAESRLVLHDGALVAVLVLLSELHGDDAGRWYLEAGFGRLDHSRPPTFVDLDEARAWIAKRLSDATA